MHEPTSALNTDLFSLNITFYLKLLPMSMDRLLYVFTKLYQKRIWLKIVKLALSRKELPKNCSLSHQDKDLIDY